MPVWADFQRRLGSLSLGVALGVGTASASDPPPIPPAPPPEEGVPPVLRIAQAPTGSAAEAIPEVPTPPAFSSSGSVHSLSVADSPFVHLKKATARYTLLAGRGNDLGLDMLDGEATFTLRDLESLTITPSAGVVFADGPIRTDVPPRLFNGQLEFRWFGQIATPVFYEVAFLPALFTDGENVGNDALRLQGRGVGYLALSEQTQILLGATYLDREDVPILPVFGVLHSPKDDLKLELVFPRPRILKRVGQEAGAETWAYITGELGGGSWAIERQNGSHDIVSYRDYRVLLGLEQKQLEKWSANVEAGYVFGRELEYESRRGDYSPNGTLILRLALSH